MRGVLIVLALVLNAGCGAAPAPQSQEAPSPQAAAPQKAPDENAALAAITNINKAQKDFFARYRRYALTYEELIDAFFLKEEPTTASTGYDVRLRPAADAASYTIRATPVTPSATAKHFFSDQTGEIHAEKGKDADAQSPKI
jgi:hypothetical protein